MQLLPYADPDYIHWLDLLAACTGTFGRVYRGLLDGVIPVAIKELHADAAPAVFLNEVTFRRLGVHHIQLKAAGMTNSSLEAEKLESD